VPPSPPPTTPAPPTSASSTSAGEIGAESLGVWSRVQSRRCRPGWVRIGGTARRSRNRSKRAESSLPVSGEGHSFAAPRQSFSGTRRTTPSPESKIRSLRIFRRQLRIADEPLKHSSMKAKSASGSLPVVTRTYLSTLSPARLTGPISSSTVVNLVSRTVNRVPPVQDSTESSKSDLPYPGGPTSSTCSFAKSAVRARSISSSRSIRAADSSARAVANLSCTGCGALDEPTSLGYPPVDVRRRSDDSRDEVES
jgi:hypothetical protein